MPVCSSLYSLIEGVVKGPSDLGFAMCCALHHQCAWLRPARQFPQSLPATVHAAWKRPRCSLRRGRTLLTPIDSSSAITVNTGGSPCNTVRTTMCNRVVVDHSYALGGRGNFASPAVLTSFTNRADRPTLLKGSYQPYLALRKCDVLPARYDRIGMCQSGGAG